MGFYRNALGPQQIADLLSATGWSKQSLDYLRTNRLTSNIERAWIYIHGIIHGSPDSTSTDVWKNGANLYLSNSTSLSLVKGSWIPMNGVSVHDVAWRLLAVRNPTWIHQYFSHPNQYKALRAQGIADYVWYPLTLSDAQAGRTVSRTSRSLPNTSPSASVTSPSSTSIAVAPPPVAPSAALTSPVSAPATALLPISPLPPKPALAPSPALVQPQQKASTPMGFGSALSSIGSSLVSTVGQVGSQVLQSAATQVAAAASQQVNQVIAKALGPSAPASAPAQMPIVNGTLLPTVGAVSGALATGGPLVGIGAAAQVAGSVASPGFPVASPLTKGLSLMLPAPAGPAAPGTALTFNPGNVLQPIHSLSRFGHMSKKKVRELQYGVVTRSGNVHWFPVGVTPGEIRAAFGFPRGIQMFVSDPALPSDVRELDEKRRSINPLNPKAARRAARRLGGLHKFLRSTEKAVNESFRKAGGRVHRPVACKKKKR